jgi:S1-C subfamily serine protease
MNSPRRTRSRVRQNSDKEVTTHRSTTLTAEAVDEMKTSKIGRPPIKLLPTKVTTKTTSLGSTDHALLLLKERWLRSYKIVVLKATENMESAVQATLVFAQEEAGTAVCISQRGFLLTCSHCVAESAEEFDKEKSHWLLFASGRVVETKCVAWDSKRDLALLQVVSTQPVPITMASSQSQGSSTTSTFPYISIAERAPRIRAAMACVGHPGSEDLEADVQGIKTNYDIL